MAASVIAIGMSTFAKVESCRWSFVVVMFAFCC
jgi:hypothetical protein